MAMADGYGLFWNSDSGDRKYDAQSFEKWLKKFFTSGVFEGDLQVLASSGMTVQVQTGYSNVNGKVGLFESATNVTLSAANSRYPRIDTIIIERNDANRVIQIDKVTGAYTGENPQPTAPIWDETQGIYQLVLAQIYVRAGVSSISQEDITDKRTDTDVCGYIAGTVNEMDFSQFTAQFEAYFSTFEATQLAEFETWFEHMKDQLDEDAAGHLQAEVDDLNNNKAPTSHSSEDTIYGIGTATKYGHCKTINALTQSSHADGTALSAYQGKVLNDKIGNLSNLNTTDKSSTVAAINEVNTKVSKTEVLINNSGDAFSSSKTYSVGDLCIHDNKLYRCITACSAGSWATNQRCFTQDTLVNVVSDIADSINNTKVIQVRDISNYNSSSNTFNIMADGYIKLIADGAIDNVTAAYIMPTQDVIAYTRVTKRETGVLSTFFVKKGMEFYFSLSEHTYSKVLYYKLG